MCIRDRFRMMRLLFTRAFKEMFRGIPKMFSEGEKYKNARPELLELMKDWAKTIQHNGFHGGAEPDEADFAMFALLKTKANSRSFQRFIENKFPDAVWRWFIRMQMRCVYEEQSRFMMDASGGANQSEDSANAKSS
eukprot:TRINITY_DN5022_c0_g1_i1.p1 TRINITY_DN5022_c0_g1~~TRINITY_DN5022_c0_g1_i1.p1  ORF type:complete len:136 (+),score=21.78 TRINITY_DN5022_c0_g1_i1:65-472(+)